MWPALTKESQRVKTLAAKGAVQGQAVATGGVNTHYLANHDARLRLTSAVSVTSERVHRLDQIMRHIVPYPKLRLAFPSADRKWRDHWCVGLFKLPHKGNQVIPKRWVRLPPRTRGRARNGDSGSECTRSSGATRRRCRAGGEARLFRILEEPGPSIRCTSGPLRERRLGSRA